MDVRGWLDSSAGPFLGILSFLLALFDLERLNVTQTSSISHVNHLSIYLPEQASCNGLYEVLYMIRRKSPLLSRAPEHSTAIDFTQAISRFLKPCLLNIFIISNPSKMEWTPAIHLLVRENPQPMTQRLESKHKWPHVQFRNMHDVHLFTKSP